MKKSILDKIYDESWEEDKYDDMEDCIAENCPTYEVAGQLFVQLLSYHAGRYDDEAVRLLSEMMVGYIEDNI